MQCAGMTPAHTIEEAREIILKKQKIPYVFGIEEKDTEKLIGHFVDNIASKRVIEKLGFVYEGCFRKVFSHYQLGAIDECMYSLLKDEWVKR